MEFKEAYKKGLKTGKAITNGSYELKLLENGLECHIVDDNTKTPDIIGILLDTFEDNWEIIMEE